MGRPKLDRCCHCEWWNCIYIVSKKTTLYISQLCSKNDVDKRLDKIRRRRLNEDDEDDEDEDKDSDEGERKAKINAAHNKYMTEVISALIFSADATINLADHLPVIMAVVAGSRRFEKALFKIAQAVENATVVDPHNPLAELLYLNISALQSASDRLIAPQSLPIWQQYLAIMFEQTSIAADSLAAAPVLTSEGDVLYLEQFVQLLAETSDAELEFHMWWTVVDDLVLHTTSDIRKLHTEYMQTITPVDSGGSSGGVSRSFYCTAGVHELLGWAVSWSMVAIDGRQFDTETGPKVAEMLQNIRESFNDMVRMTTWMDDGTKCATLEKSLAMRSQIGYPAWMANGTSLDGYYAGVRAMNGTRHLDNMVSVLRWVVAKNLGALNEYDADEWATTPTNVNAFHTFQENMISNRNGLYVVSRVCLFVRVGLFQYVQLLCCLFVRSRCLVALCFVFSVCDDNVMIMPMMDVLTSLDLFL